MKKIIFVLLTFIIFSCNEKSKPEFSLLGKTREIENGTVLYLENYLTKKIIDSASVHNNSFEFKTQLRQTPVMAMLRTKERSHSRMLWLENTPMTFDQTESSFQNAYVTGAESESLSQSLHKEIDKLPKQENFIKATEFVEKNPTSVVSAMTLFLYSTSWGKEKTKRLFDLFSTENKESEYGKRIQKYLDVNREPQIGEQFVDFEMTDTKGNLKKLSELKGKVMLLEFWASWCVPCRKENPDLVKTYKKYNPNGFEIFAVSIDDNKKSWLEAIEKDNLNWEHVSDLSGKENTAALIYGVKSLPTNFLINEKGTIIGTNLRGEELSKKLKELLN
jgi:peroxiredoxin